MSKVQILRFWLLAIFAVAWAVLYIDPTLAIVPVAFFTGQNNCFCCPNITCLDCTGPVPSTVQIEVSGMADAACSTCEDCDGTYVVGWAANCNWSVGTTTNSCLGTGGESLTGISFTVQIIGSGWQVNACGSTWIDTASLIACADIAYSPATFNSNSPLSRCTGASAVVSVDASP